MKYLKFISICLLASFTMSVSAEVTSQATIKIKGDVGGISEQVFLTEDNAAPTDFSSNDNAFFKKGTSNLAVELYAVNGTDKYSTVVIKSLDNLKLKFVANAYEQKYTMSFSDVTGFIGISNADTSFVIDATKDYKFTCDKSATIEFTISMPQVYSRDVTSGSWGTLCLPWASVAVEGAEMFTVAGKDAAEPTGVYLEEYANNLVAGQPYVFKATDSKLKVSYFPATEVAADTVNGLIGSYVEKTIAAGMYIIDGDQLKNTDGTCKVRENGAFFDFGLMSIYTPQPGPGAPVRFMSIRGASTELENVNANVNANGKMILNGRMVIVKDGKMFNAQGAQL